MLDTVPQEKFLSHVEEVGKYFKDKLIDLQKKYPEQISEVRGEGLILGLQLGKSKKSGVEIVNAAMERGAIINCTVGTVLRFIPPLIITKENVDDVISILDEVFSE